MWGGVGGGGGGGRSKYWCRTHCTSVTLSSLFCSDFMSHVAYTEGDWGKLENGDRQNEAYNTECPASHPVRIPEVQFYFRIVDYKGGHHVFSDGTSSVHADYFSGWNETELQEVPHQPQDCESLHFCAVDLHFIVRDAVNPSATKARVHGDGPGRFKIARELSCFEQRSHRAPWRGARILVWHAGAG